MFIAAFEILYVAAQVALSGLVATIVGMLPRALEIFTSTFRSLFSMRDRKACATTAGPVTLDWNT